MVYPVFRQPHFCICFFVLVWVISIYIYTYHYISRYNPVSCVPFHTFLPQTTSALKSHRISWDHPEATYLMVPSATAARAAARLLASTQQLHPYWGEEPLEKDFSCSIIFQDVCTWYIYIYYMYVYIYICKRDLSVLFDGLTNLHSKENKVNKDWFSLFTFWGSRKIKKIKKIKIYFLYFLYLLFEAPGK